MWHLNITGESGQENGTNTFNLVLSARGCLMIAGAQVCDFIFYLIAPLQCYCCWETSLLTQRECLFYCHVKFFFSRIDKESSVKWDLFFQKITKHVKFTKHEKSIKTVPSQGQLVLMIVATSFGASLIQESISLSAL